ncbi:hypothetical protein CAPTEDRAFT_199128 [Capitella teleta]|uniref:L-Fucosyltransferase n=1 Tax=Capitella teleta TaxID=283909 RepID=R7VCD1_CAPTE|nr:hypothetical protein CAPTEDRAFT_199128 [Capitella teleta]|eukprot:ELU13976.1 hypothetical protein CAPTEDRAFT_199128 [Capitella teleta]
MAREEFKRIVPNVTFGSDPVKAKVAGGTLVTLHVRHRGDIMKENYQNMRYTFPGRSFFENSIQFFADADPNLHVVVCCVDIEWCRSNLTDLPATFYFSESKNAIVDLAIMSMGEHAIMTTGTFGWWGAWLANGETVYYSNWPRHGSQMVQIRYVRQDFFMPHWIVLWWRSKSDKNNCSLTSRDQETKPLRPDEANKEITPNKKQPPLHATEKPPKNTTKVYVTGNVYGFRRTGNRLFVFAAIMAVTWRYSMTSVLSPEFELQKYFNIDYRARPGVGISNWAGGRM